MKFSCDLPIDFDDSKVEFSTNEAIMTMAQAMEKAGFSATYVTDHPAPSSRWLAGAQEHSRYQNKTKQGPKFLIHCFFNSFINIHKLTLFFSCYLW